MVSGHSLQQSIFARLARRPLRSPPSLSNAPLQVSDVAGPRLEFIRKVSNALHSVCQADLGVLGLVPLSCIGLWGAQLGWLEEHCPVQQGSVR